MRANAPKCATPPPTSIDPGSLTGVDVAATLPTSAPVLARFVRTGDLEARTDAHLTRAGASESELAVLRTWLDSCP